MARAAMILSSITVARGKRRLRYRIEVETGKDASPALEQEIEEIVDSIAVVIG